MKNKIMLFSFLTVFCFSQSEAKTVKNQVTSDYIKKYASIAIVNMQDHGIPASITLAQAVLESGSGKSELAKKSNNHFGIKCHNNWTGDKVYHDDDKAQECFRKYKSVELSFEDHSQFLKKDRYKELFELDIRDYKGWAKGLKKCGYATAPDYAKKLIDLIELYELYNYDNGTLSITITENPTKKEESQTAASSMGYITAYRTHDVKKIGRVKSIIAMEGDTYEQIAEEFDLNLWQLRRYNNVKRNDGKKPVAGETIYITRH